MKKKFKLKYQSASKYLNEYELDILLNIDRKMNEAYKKKLIPKYENGLHINDIYDSLTEEEKQEKIQLTEKTQEENLEED